MSETGKRIIATFIPQYKCRLTGDIYNEDESEWQQVDVTNTVLALSKKEALEIENDTEESDWLIPEEIRDEHGPYAVRVQQEIRDYFDYFGWLGEDD